MDCCSLDTSASELLADRVFAADSLDGHKSAIARA
jgi:hypothetical protein